MPQLTVGGCNSDMSDGFPSTWWWCFLYFYHISSDYASVLNQPSNLRRAASNIGEFFSSPEDKRKENEKSLIKWKMLFKVEAKINNVVIQLCFITTQFCGNL